MKTKFTALFAFTSFLTFSATQSKAQTLIQFWDFNQIRPITGAGADSLGTVTSYTNTAVYDSTNATWPLTAVYTAAGLTPGHIIYSRPTTVYSTKRDSILDGVGPGGSPYYDYSSNNYTYFTSSDSGFAEGNAYLKARNPSDSCVLYLYIPTTGYQNIQLQYAVSQSSTKGATYNIFSYSTSGAAGPWKNLTTAMDTFNIGGVYRPDTLQMSNHVTDSTISWWYPVQINFTSNPSVNNNANFILRFMLAGATSTGTSGNDRYDNFAVWGTVATGSKELSSSIAGGYNVYPNPISNDITVTSNHYTGAKVITLYDIVGQSISVLESNNKQTTINTSSLNEGVYFVEIKEVSTGNKYTVKVVKN